MIAGKWLASRGRVAAAIALVAVLGVVVAWCLRDPWPARVVIRPREWHYPLGFAPDGRTYQTRGPRGVFRWDVATGREVGFTDFPFTYRSCWIEDGRGTLLMIADRDQYNSAVVLADAATGAVQARWPIADRMVIGLRFADDGRSVGAMLLDRKRLREVVTWDRANGTETRREIAGPPDGQARPFAIAGDGRTWAYSHLARDAIILWDGDTDRPLGPVLRHPSASPVPIMSGTFSSDGRMLAFVRIDGWIELWDVPAARLIRTARAHPADFRPNQIEFSPDGRTLVSAAVEPPTSWREWARNLFNRFAPRRMILEHRRELVLIDVATGAILGRSAGSDFPQYSPDGRTVITHEQDGSFSLRPVPEH